MKLSDFNGVLSRAGLPVYYREAAVEETGDYVVYHEYRRNDDWADDKPLVKVWRVQVDMYTRTPFDPRAERFEAILADNGIPFTITTDYNSESGVYRYIFQCDVTVETEATTCADVKGKRRNRKA